MVPSRRVVQVVVVLRVVVRVVVVQVVVVLRVVVRVVPPSRERGRRSLR
jgi:hypothetical protein